MDAHRALDRLAAQRAVAAAARLKVLHAVDAEAAVAAHQEGVVGGSVLAHDAQLSG